MPLMDTIVEQFIQKAIRDGEFDNLPGFGKPLPEEDFSGPAHLRMAYKIMKDNNVVPPEVALLNEIATLRKQRDACTDKSKRKKLTSKMMNLQVQYDIMMEARGLKTYF